MPSSFKDSLEQTYFSTHYVHFMPQTPEGWAWVLERLGVNFGGVFQSLSRDSRILDVPCGVGYLEHYLLKEGFQKIDCVDLSKEQIGMAKQKLTEFGLDFSHKVQFILADAFTYLEKAEPYDLIAVIDFLDHLKKDQVGELLTLAHSALRPGGVLLSRVTNADNPLFSQYFYRDFTHETGFTPSTIRQCLEAAGFKVEKVDYEKVGPIERTLIGGLKGRIRSAGRYVLAKLLGIPYAAFTEDLIAVARK
jgi:SAM-dependent methyltransferase